MIKEIKNLGGQILRKRGILMWPTKPFEIWLLVFCILKKQNPATILELGSGRSTNFLAEYAFKKEKVFVSIEQNKHFVRKINKCLHEANIPHNYVKHVPIRADWFDEARFVKETTGSKFDFIFIDAPGGIDFQGNRASTLGLKLMKEVMHDDTFFIIDDTDRPEVKDALLNLCGSRKIVTIKYEVRGNCQRSEISLLIPKKIYSQISELLDFSIAESTGISYELR